MAQPGSDSPRRGECLTTPGVEVRVRHRDHRRFGRFLERLALCEAVIRGELQHDLFVHFFLGDVSRVECGGDMRLERGWGVVDITDGYRDEAAFPTCQSRPLPDVPVDEVQDASMDGTATSPAAPAGDSPRRTPLHPRSSPPVPVVHDRGPNHSEIGTGQGFTPPAPLRLRSASIDGARLPRSALPLGQPQ